MNPLVELRDVRVSYGSLDALAGVSLTIRRGERVAVIGPSGAGKSTLLAVLNGTVAATSGTVSFDGEPVRDSDGWRRDHGRRIAMIAQQLHLTGPLRAIHNVNAGRLASWSTARALWSLVSPREVREARAALDAVGIADKLYTRTDQLSGGEQQRVAIARALRQSPELILADEPTASLDPTRASEVMRLLAHLAMSEGCTLLVSQHDVALALSSCDRFIGLRAGHIVFDRAGESPTHDEIDALYAIDVRDSR